MKNVPGKELNTETREGIMTVATATETNTPERSPRAPTAANPRRWWVLAVMSLSIFMIFVDNTVVNTAIPSIARDLQASTSVLQWVVDSYTLVLAGLVLAGGTIGDRFGRRRWMMIGMVTFGLASAGAALSDSANTLIAFRALQGVGAALVMPATLSILTDVFPREERAKAIGIWTAAGGLGVGFGPAVGLSGRLAQLGCRVLAAPPGGCDHSRRADDRGPGVP